MNSPMLLLPTDAWVRWALVPVLAFVALAADRNYLADFWHHLARGEVMAAEGALVDEDRFTYTVAGRPLRDVNWLTQLGYHGLFRVGGLELVRVANALLTAATFALLVWLCRTRSGSLPAATVAGALTFFGLWNVLTVRPQTLSLLLFVALYAILDRSERRPRLLFLAPATLALWANVHGAFPAGLVLIGCFLLASAWDARRGAGWRRDARTLRLLATLAAGALATLINPYGWSIYGYVGLTSNAAAVRRIDEWVPPSLHHWIGVAFFLSLPLLAGLLVLARRRGRPWTTREVFLIVCFLPLAAGSIRMVAWWLLVIAPMMAERVALLLPRPAEGTEQPSVGAGVVVVLLALLAASALPPLQHLNPLLQLTRGGPLVEDDLEAVRHEAMCGRGEARVFSRFEWGEYLGWAGAPRLKVFMDARIEIIPDEVWDEYARVTCGRDGWEEILDRRGVDFLVLDASYHARTGLLPRALESQRWSQAFAARDALLFVRR